MWTSTVKLRLKTNLDIEFFLSHIHGLSVFSYRPLLVEVPRVSIAPIVAKSS